MGPDMVHNLPVLGQIPNTWSIVEFGTLLDGSARNGVYKPKEFHGRGAKIINMGELFAHPRLRAIPMRRVELTPEELLRSGIKQGDLLFARRSLVAEGAGKCAIVLEVEEPTTFESSLIRARPNSAVADSLFLFYLFNSPFGSYALGSILRQVAVSGIASSDLVKLRLPLPPLAEQRAIARIFGTLDEKIELNQRMNGTLEEIVRAVFRSWFVDFDPVHANAEGRQPEGMDAATASLFPDAFNETKSVPSGWEIHITLIASCRSWAVPWTIGLLDDAIAHGRAAHERRFHCNGVCGA